MIIHILFIIVFIITIILHELGHYMVAKKQGIYKGWGILPTPHIKLTKPYKTRISYLFGFFMSLLVIPVWLLIDIELWITILFLLILSIGDFLTIIFWKKVTTSR